MVTTCVICSYYQMNFNLGVADDAFSKHGPPEIGFH